MSLDDDAFKFTVDLRTDVSSSSVRGAANTVPLTFLYGAAERVMPIQSIPVQPSASTVGTPAARYYAALTAARGNVGAVEEDDTVYAAVNVSVQHRRRTRRRMHTVTSDMSARNPAYYVGKHDDHGEMRSDLWMSAIARYVFFFSPKTKERVFDPTIADFRNEVMKARAEGRSADVRLLHIQYWGAFIITLIGEVWDSTLLKIIRSFIAK